MELYKEQQFPTALKPMTISAIEHLLHPEGCRGKRRCPPGTETGREKFRAPHTPMRILSDA